MAKLRPIKSICLNCFGELNSDGVCTSCNKPDDTTLKPPHQLPLRTLLNKKYVIARTLGEGGFGITYLAWDILSGQKVAIKEYFPGGFVTRDLKNMHILVNQKQNSNALTRGLGNFIEEAQNLSKLNYLKGIVRVLDFFEANNSAYIVMEFLDGVSLKRYIQKKGTLSATTVLTILKPVIMSLKEVHADGIIHRDISPDNIIITRTNDVKLIDFGAAKQISTDDQKISVVLKQGFAPEEQYRKRGEQGPWTDIYAIGVTIYYCITGKLPPESIQRLYEDTIIPPRMLDAKITVSQEKHLLKALAVRRKDRYKDLDEFTKAFYPNKTKKADDYINTGEIRAKISHEVSKLPPDADKPQPIEENRPYSIQYYDYDEQTENSFMLYPDGEEPAETSATLEKQPADVIEEIAPTEEKTEKDEKMSETAVIEKKIVSAKKRNNRLENGIWARFSKTVRKPIDFIQSKLSKKDDD